MYNIYINHMLPYIFVLFNFDYLPSSLYNLPHQLDWKISKSSNLI